MAGVKDLRPPDSMAALPHKRRPVRWPRFQLLVSERRLLLIAGDLIATLASVALALMLWAYNAKASYTSEFIMSQWLWFLILPGLWFVLAESNDYYNLRVSARLRSSFVRLVIIMGELLIIYLATFFFSPVGSLPRRFILYYAAISFVLTGVWRGCRLFLIGWTGFRRRVLVVGAGQAGEMICHALKTEAYADYNVLGFVTSVFDRDFQCDPSMPVLGTGAALPDLVLQHGISELVMAYVNRVPEDVFSGAMTCYEQGVEITPVTALYEQITGRVPIEHVGEHLWTLVLPVARPTLALTLYLVVKRLLDCVFAIIGLMLFGLVLPLLALVIKLDSRGPVFYRQQRMGRGGRLFVAYKLRSMIVGAESTSGPRWAQARDRRTTHVGRVLRKLRLDEAPQLLNVLRNEMSLVGPRPERPEFVHQLSSEIPYYRARLAVKPGLTGWAQVRYRYGNSVEDAWRKLQYDLYYIRHRSLALDVSIMLRTIGTVLLMRGT